MSQTNPNAKTPPTRVSEVDVPFDAAEAALHKCNCMNGSAHTDPTQHNVRCYYVTWYQSRQRQTFEKLQKKE